MDANQEVLQQLSQQNYGLDFNGAVRVASGLNSDANGVCVQLFGTSRNACFDELLDLLSVGHAMTLPGESGAYASTPDHASLDITGDLDIRADLAMDDWSPSSFQVIAGKYHATGNQRSYRLGLATNGAVEFRWSNDGSTLLTATSTSTVASTGNGERLAVRATIDVDNGASGRTVRFYTAPTIEGPWAALGSAVTTAGATSIFSGSATLAVGSDSSGTNSNLAGDVYAVEVRNGINGTVVANPDFRPVRSGLSSFSDSTGKTWTLNGGAEVVVLNIF